MHKTVTPYADSGSGKKEQVEKMFDSISHKYDFLNRSLSAGIDIWWRKKIVAALHPDQPRKILDIATGTADVAIALSGLRPEKITGIDLSEGMLAYGRKKIQARGLENLISLQKADSEKMPFADSAFDAVTVAFGVRNFENLQAGLQEMERVIRKGGKVVILEFSQPKAFPVKQLYDIYFKYFCPWWGKLFSKDASAYKYLYESVQVFPEGKDFEERMKQAGFSEIRTRRMSLGIVSLYTAIK
jgi:demethylmenaquinone methyltransferase / 2-methoxy-6-polyprenyl-1,4-benzoquinol methylase